MPHTTYYRQTDRHFRKNRFFLLRGSQNVKIWWKFRKSFFTWNQYLLIHDENVKISSFVGKWNFILSSFLKAITLLIFVESRFVGKRQFQILHKSNTFSYDEKVKFFPIKIYQADYVEFLIIYCQCQIKNGILQYAWGYVRLSALRFQTANVLDVAKVDFNRSVIKVRSTSRKGLQLFVMRYIIQQQF